MADSTNDAPPAKKARFVDGIVGALSACDSTCDMSGQACDSSGLTDSHTELVTDQDPDSSDSSARTARTTATNSSRDNIQVSSTVNTQTLDNLAVQGSSCTVQSQPPDLGVSVNSNTTDLHENSVVEGRRDQSQCGTSSSCILNATSSEKRNSGDQDEHGRSTIETDCIGEHGKNALLKEADVGITEYISTHEGFNGVIKQRYSDFLVNEISLSGDIVRLTDLSVPASDTKEKSKPDDVLSEEWVTQLQELVDSKDKSRDVTFQVGEDKDSRGKIHQAIRDLFPGLESSTVKVDDKTCIKVMLKGAQGRSRSQAWPSGRGNYCRFVLYKENKDVAEAIFLIAKYFRMKASAFTFAGTKDRRARTCQEVTVYRVLAENLQKLNRSLRNIAVGDFRYCNSPLKLGDLKGNRFVIVLRNVTGKDEQILQGVTSLKDVGFINYYGMQRFGTTSVATHHVGRALMKSNWQEAVELILKPREGDNDDLAEARKIWWETRNAKDALQKIGRHQSIEKQLLIGLSKYEKNDLVSALNMIPRNSRLMYVHSYQSYVWNSLVSRRIQKYGLKPVVGDLVSKSRTTPSEESDCDKKQFLVPEVVTQDSLDSWSVHHIVMPLPGWDVRYPENEVGQWYRHMMSEDGLDIDQMKHRVKDYSLAGAYRHIVVKPEDVTWELCTYNDVTVPLVQSDLDKLNDVPVPEPVTDGKFKALKLELSLPSSTYATMAIREVLKSDTSAAHQTTLNVT